MLNKANRDPIQQRLRTLHNGRKAMRRWLLDSSSRIVRLLQRSIGTAIPDSTMLRYLVLVIALTLTACVTPGQRIDRDAAHAGLLREIATGGDFRHVIYQRTSASPSLALTVYLEGDGIPWIGGRAPAIDPTTMSPLALRLMVQTSEPAIYVSRPCYQALLDPNCTAHLWTSGRYSSAIVDSMATVIEAKARALGARELTLVGYSGGGVLAVLIAERLESVRAVITIGANLDIEAWTTHHHYLPLSDSLNPAMSERPHSWRETHLYGARDKTVPVVTTHRYFERYPAAQQVTLDEYDHVCCWEKNWLSLYPQASSGPQ